MRGDAKTAALISEQVARDHRLLAGFAELEIGLHERRAKELREERQQLVELRANLKECNTRLARMLGENDGE